MSNDELASNDEIKEFKEEGEEDRLASEHLHSRLRHNLLEQVRCYNAIKVPLTSSHHRTNPTLAAYHHLSSSLDTAHHHHHYLHPPPPAHMPKWIGLDLEGGQYPPPPLSHFSHLPQWYPSPASGMYPTSPFYSPPHYLNFPTHPLPSPLSHSLFYSPPPPPPTTPQFNSHHHYSHNHLPTTIPPPSSTSSTSSSSSTSSNSSILSLSITPHQQEQHQSSGQQDQQPNTPNSLHNFSHIKKPLNAFMLYMKEKRAEVAAQSSRKESATINQILGKNWHLLSPEEQAIYYAKAESAREAHREQYPCWTAKDNYANNKKKKKTKREKTAEGEGSLKKCRARFGLEQQTSWCKPCRRKKKCIRFSDEKTVASI